MYLSAFPHLLRAPGEDSGPCSSLIIQPSYRTRHIANSFKIPGSRSLTPSTCNANSGGQDTGQCLVFYPDPFFTAQCQFTVDGQVVDWDLDQTLANLSTFLEPVLVNDIKVLSSSSTFPPCASQKGYPPFPPWLLAIFLLKFLLIQYLGNESHPSSNHFKHTLSFGNNQGSNKKPRQDDNDDDDDIYDPDDYGDNGRDHDNNDGETPGGIGVAKGKDKEKALFCCIFHKLDPVRWPICGQRRLTSFAYLLQHLRRQHLIKGHFYCARCRAVWSPKREDSEALWAAHKRDDNCEEATAADTGRLLPDEYDLIKGSKSAGSDWQRWYETWKMLFEDYDAPDTPYSEDVAQGTEASILCKLKRALKKRLSPLPPGPLRDQMEALTDSVLEDVFPAYAMRGSANAGPSTAGPSTARVHHTPQTMGQHMAPVTNPASTPALTPRPPGPVIYTRTPAGQQAPPRRQLPNTSDQNPGSAGFFTNPGLTGTHGGLPANYTPMNTALLGNPAFARHPGLTNARLPVDPRLIDPRLLENPALTRNTGMMNPTDPRYQMMTRQANLGQMNYEPPPNPGNSMTINPSLLTIPGPANPGPSAPPTAAHPPSNPINIQHRNRNAFRRNNNTQGFDQEAFAASVGRGIEAFNSISQDPEQPSDTEEYPETGQPRWRRIQ
ncbi:hypothetical protein NCS52_01252000 [Fusarium sp. LHS14.1]|nr:hypothetical protein NCS52_01252000 [Fusarium sp. LHS14.1]